jgi:hypothetical protein
VFFAEGPLIGAQDALALVAEKALKKLFVVWSESAEHALEKGHDRLRRLSGFAIADGPHKILKHAKVIRLQHAEFLVHQRGFDPCRERTRLVPNDTGAAFLLANDADELPAKVAVAESPEMREKPGFPGL